MDNYLGEIRLFAGNFAPVGWYFCDGRLLPIADNDALFALLGTTYGGDGQTTFALPNFCSRVVSGMGNGPGLTPRVQGEVSGTETVTLTTSQLPVHNHTLNATTAAANTASPTNALLAQPANGGLMYLDPNFTRTGDKVALTVTDAQIAATSVAVTGGSQPHSNVMPSLGMNFIIAYEGIFPPRN